MWDWSNFFTSLAAGAVLAVAGWLITRVVSWARNRKETLPQYLKKIGASLFVVISVVGAVLLFSLLLSALASYYPIVWYDVMMTLARFALVIPGLFLVAAVVGIFLDQARGKDLIQLMAMMFGALLAIVFLRASYEHLEREKDKLLQTSKVSGQAATNNLSRSYLINA